MGGSVGGGLFYSKINQSICRWSRSLVFSFKRLSFFGTSNIRWNYEICTDRNNPNLVRNEPYQFPIRHSDCNLFIPPIYQMLFLFCLFYFYHSPAWFVKTKKCSFDFESWTMNSYSLILDKNSTSLVDSYFSSPQWHLCRHRSVIYDHFYEITGDYFTRATFQYVMRRKSTFYVINLIFPCATLSIIQMLVFIIPSTDSTSDRIGFGTTNLLTMVVFQTIVTAEMPKSSDAVSALSRYIIVLIITSSCGILQSVIVEKILRASTEPPPKLVLKLCKLIPQVWNVQMPSGINQMILEGSSGTRHVGAIRKSISDGLRRLQRGLSNRSRSRKLKNKQSKCVPECLKPDEKMIPRKSIMKIFNEKNSNNSMKSRLSVDFDDVIFVNGFGQNKQPLTSLFSRAVLETRKFVSLILF